MRPTVDNDPRSRVKRVAEADILHYAPFLEGLAARCGQAGAMHWLGYFLSKGELQGKRAVLLLITDGEVPSLTTLNAVWGAVLVTEYTIVGLPTRVFTTDDAGGYRTVVAPLSRRMEAATLAIGQLQKDGARAALVTVDAKKPATEAVVFAVPACKGWKEGRRDRSMARFLDLEPSLEATLAKLGKSTRFNLGYYRRRLERSETVCFEADAAGLLSQTELDRLNERSLNPVESNEFRLRCESGRRLLGSFFMGLRTASGEWLSLVCGWRQDACTVLHWQLNVRGREKDSIGTVMRSYLLQHEIERGARSLLIYGGTPHTMRHAFRPDIVSDIVVKRTASWRVRALLWCATFARHRLPGRPLIVEALTSPETVWLDVKETLNASSNPAPQREAPVRGRLAA